jgi:hypothetical protein
MVIKTPNGRRTQIWYFDQRSLTIKTRLNNQSWDIKSAGRTNDMQIWSTNSGWFQVFKYENSQFINWSNKKVLDVKGGKDEEGQPVGVWGNNRGRHQQWFFDEVTKTIRSNYWKNYCLEIDGSGNGRWMRNRGINSRWW